MELRRASVEILCARHEVRAVRVSGGGVGGGRVVDTNGIAGFAVSIDAGQGADAVQVAVVRVTVAEWLTEVSWPWRWCW